LAASSADDWRTFLAAVFTAALSDLLRALFFLSCRILFFGAS
jgi:hypothetical protein